MTKRFPLLISVIATVITSSAGEPYREPYRPQFHFTPERNWMNDPNGMVYFEGEWHLFYQYNPFGNKWGHMSWGHAVSRDLVRWEHLPVALAEEDGVMIFSGSAVVDWKNTSGFGKAGAPPLVAIYTGHREKRQDQRIAYSNDRGRTWTKYVGNPVLDVNMADFRDPKVMWHEPTQRWVMTVVLATEKKVHFYTSADLKGWKYAGEFGPAGATGGVWECPDLFPLPVEGESDTTKWVLIVNINPGGPAGGSGCQYFVGDFDGTRFTQEPPEQAALWADYGADFYAGVSWSDVPKADGRRIWLGWMSNWNYAEAAPTSPWRSAMSVPRTMGLRRTPDGLRLVQRPVAELATLRAGAPHKFAGGSFAEAAKWLGEQPELPALLEVEITFSGVKGKAPFTVQLQTGKDELTALRCDPSAGQITVDRSRSGQVTFHPRFSVRHHAPARFAGDRLSLQLLLDTSSLEIFAQQGETVFTELIFPSDAPRRIGLASEGDSPSVAGISIQPLRSAVR